MGFLNTISQKYYQNTQFNQVRKIANVDKMDLILNNKKINIKIYKYMSVNQDKMKKLYPI